MKKLLLSSILLISANQAFCKDIHCVRGDKKVQVTLGINDEFNKVSSLRILKLGWFGINEVIDNPDCQITLNGNVHNVIANITCEDGLLDVWQPINGFNAGQGNAQVKIGLKEQLLTCKTK